MNITVDSPPVILAVFIVWTVIFLLSLAHALGRNDIDPVTRLTWVVVLIFVPFFGIMLYTLSAKVNRQPRGTAGSEVFGTPWADNPGHMPSSSED
jgi:hypothetical protein